MSKKKNNSPNPSSKKTYKGELEISKSGMGFVKVSSLQQDILVRPHDFGKAFHGDIVSVEVLSSGNGNRMQGKITDVVHRSKTEFIGNIEITKKVAFFIPSNERSPDFYVPLSKLKDATDGDKVVIRFVKWEGADRKPEGEVIEVVTAKNEGDLAMKEILVEAGFPLKFEDEVVKAAAKLDGKITREEIRKRKDCRDILTFTIDPVDAKDFDDAISIRNLDNSYYEIGVHIADVSQFVTAGSILDQSAYERATSVYLPDRVNPMLPEKISNELCSLRPNEDKYTFSVIFQITNRGEIKHKWIGRTIIHSNHRFTYEEVQHIIETNDGLHHNALLLLNDLAKKFRAERFKNGAINFSSQEVRFKLDADGKPIGIEIKESLDAHKLIEEFMLLANRTVAEYVSRIRINKEPIPFPYRIHDTPDEEKLQMFVAFAKKFGYKFNTNDEKAVAESFNSLLKEIEGKPEQHVLEQIGIRTMAKAMYTPKNIGHYGLGFENYCHFTSPIRRYPDILTHRIIQQCLDKNVHPDKKMEEKCLHSSERERAAMEAERSGNKYKQVEYLRSYIGDEFDAVISGVSHFGFWAETVEHKCEGLVSITQLSEYDDFRHEAESYALVGLRSKRAFRMGDKVRIKVISANLSRKQLDYEWVPNGEKPSKGKKNGPIKKKK